MSNDKTHQWYRSGRWTGWNTYRYGGRRERKTGPIYRTDKREKVIAFTILYLKQWRLSPFEHEGSAIAGLRSALCQKGYGWDRAHVESVSIVSECLRRMGAKRPSWYDGQREYVAPRTNCLNCGGWIDDADQASSRRFCSQECAKALLTFRAEWIDKRTSLAYRLADAEFRDRNAPGRKCIGCGKTFHSSAKDRDYCSARCHYNAIRSQEERACVQCGANFYSNVASTRCCSLRCDGLYRAAEMRKGAPEQSCPVCCSIFRPSKSGQIYCSRTCSRSPSVRAAAHQRRKSREVFTVSCVCCSEVFTTNRSNRTYCSEPCAKFHSRVVGGWLPKGLSTKVFDYFFKMAA